MVCVFHYRLAYRLFTMPDALHNHFTIFSGNRAGLGHLYPVK